MKTAYAFVGAVLVALLVYLAWPKTGDVGTKAAAPQPTCPKYLTIKTLKFTGSFWTSYQYVVTMQEGGSYDMDKNSHPYVGEKVCVTEL